MVELRLRPAPLRREKQRYQTVWKKEYGKSDPYSTTVCLGHSELNRMMGRIRAWVLTVGSKIRSVVRRGVSPHRIYLNPLPLPLGRPLPLPPRLPLLALPAVPPRLGKLLCFAVDAVLGVTEGAIVLRRGVAFILAKLASAVMKVASASPGLPSLPLSFTDCSSRFPWPCLFWKRLIDSKMGACRITSAVFDPNKGQHLLQGSQQRKHSC